MIKCNRCHKAMAAGEAQQSLTDLEEFFSRRLSPIKARQKVHTFGPQCGDCMTFRVRQCELRERKRSRGDLQPG
jgi:hypothetical protein